MTTLKNLFRDQTWLAHLLGLASITATQLTSGNALISGIVAALTAVFHVAQTFGNGTAVPPGFTVPSPKPSVAPPASTSFEPPLVGTILNASGTAEVER